MNLIIHLIKWMNDDSNLITHVLNAIFLMIQIHKITDDCVSNSDPGLGSLYFTLCSYS